MTRQLEASITIQALHGVVTGCHSPITVAASHAQTFSAVQENDIMNNGLCFENEIQKIPNLNFPN